jgi:hypothetical protein
MKNIFFALFILFACSDIDRRDRDVPMNKDLFKKEKVIGKLKTENLAEISGLEASIKNPGYFWGHNDSGDQPIVYLFDSSGEIRCEYLLKSAENIDWEDITLFRELQKSFLVVADIGDNKAERDLLTLYRIEEPTLDSLQTVVLEEVETMKITYIQGPRDAETIFYDYQSGELILITKREEEVMVYQFPFLPNETIEIISKGTLNHRNITSGDMNIDGEILIKNYQTVFYWPPSEKPTVERILEGPKFRIPYNEEPQGEAISWAEHGFYVVSEKEKSTPQELIYYERK